MIGSPAEALMTSFGFGRLIGQAYIIGRQKTQQNTSDDNTTSTTTTTTTTPRPKFRIEKLVDRLPVDAPVTRSAQFCVDSTSGDVFALLEARSTDASTLTVCKLVPRRSTAKDNNDNDDDDDDDDDEDKVDGEDLAGTREALDEAIAHLSTRGGSMAALADAYRRDVALQTAADDHSTPYRWHVLRPAARSHVPPPQVDSPAFIALGGGNNDS
jgi:hypothetical protein